MYPDPKIAISIIALAMGALACPKTTGETGRPGIQGRVLGPDGPLVEVRMSTDPPTDVRLTDSTGTFRLDEVVGKKRAPIEAGKYKLIAFKAGWEVSETELEYDGGDMTVADIRLVKINVNKPVLEEQDVPTQDPNKPVNPGGRTISDE